MKSEEKLDAILRDAKMSFFAFMKKKNPVNLILRTHVRGFQLET